MSTKLEGMPENLTTADRFTGKKVVDREGIQYGKVKHIHINPETMTVAGVQSMKVFIKTITCLTNTLTNLLTRHFC